MFAVFEDGSRQFTVKQGDKLQIDYRDEAQPGQVLTFDKILLANGGGESLLGKPAIDGAKIEAKVVEPIVKGPKLEIGRLRRRKNSRRHTGHRQKHTAIEITSITVPGLKIVAEAPPAAATTEHKSVEQQSAEQK